MAYLVNLFPDIPDWGNAAAPRPDAGHDPARTACAQKST
jgi:hypothetical protein